MKNDKTGKRTNYVARAREYRIGRLQRILRFAYAEDKSPEELREEIRKLQRESEELSWWATTDSLDDDSATRLLEAQQELKRGLNALFLEKDPYAYWRLERRGTREIARWGPGFRSSTIMALEVAFLNACADLLCTPEANRIQPCAEPGCSRLFVKRKKGAYCDLHNLPGMRSKRHREAMKESVSAEDRTIRRYCYYLTQLRRRDLKGYKSKIKELKRDWPERYQAIAARLGLSAIIPPNNTLANNP